MSPIPGETPDNRGYGTDYRSDEARVLHQILEEIRAVRATADRIEAAAGEFLPGLRALMGRRAVRAAASARDMFQGRGNHI